jgi:hypothetical protein
MSKVTANEFRMGYVEDYGPHVRLSMEHGIYHAKRHPDHPKGWCVRSCRGLTEARKIAADLQRETES